MLHEGRDARRRIIRRVAKNQNRKTTNEHLKLIVHGTGDGHPIRLKAFYLFEKVNGGSQTIEPQRAGLAQGWHGGGSAN
jgi:hypothetical protein